MSGITGTELQNWSKAAVAGEQLIYHTGFLSRDRGADVTLADVRVNGGVKTRTDEQLRIHGLAAMAWFLYESGHVHLIQRRIVKIVSQPKPHCTYPATASYEYIAVKRPWPHAPVPKPYIVQPLKENERKAMMMVRHIKPRVQPAT